VRSGVLVDKTCSDGNAGCRTGVKCLPANKLPLHGDVLHDSHAEIIARRGFLLWFYGEIALYRNTPSKFLQRSGSCPDLLELKPEYKLHVYVSTLPCKDPISYARPQLICPCPGGDASTVHLSRTQDPEIAATFQNNDLAITSAGLARGRQGFLHLGALRTKPGRSTKRLYTVHPAEP
jgi:tRNA-specific adenosine deaminase 1